MCVVVVLTLFCMTSVEGQDKLLIFQGQQMKNILLANSVHLQKC